MADEEKTDKSTDGPGREAEEPSRTETPEAEAPPEEQVTAEEAPVEAAPADDSMEGLDWKARKRLQRSRLSGEAGPQKSPEERASERRESRAAQSKSRAAHRRKRREKAEKGEGTTPAERESIAAKVRQGVVVSNKADKTITVRIDVARRHRTYEKIVRTSNTLHAHDEDNKANEGDLVRIVETRPLSKTKRWRLVDVLEEAK